MVFRYTLYNSIKGTSVLSKEPKGWDEQEILLKRDPKYHGLFRDVTIKLAFYTLAGKEYIDDVYETQGINAEITIDIDIDCNGSGTYENLYKGKLKLSSWDTYGETGQRDSFTSVDVIEIGIIQTVKDRLSTKVNLSTLETLNETPLTAFTYGPYDLNLHSKGIVKKFDLEMDSGAWGETNTGYGSATSGLFCEFPLELSPIDEVADSDEGLATQVMSSPFLCHQPAATTVQYLYLNGSASSNTINVAYNFVGTISETNAQARSYQLLIRYKVNGVFYGTASTTIQSYAAQALVGGVPYSEPINISGTISVPVPSGDSFFLFAEFNGFAQAPAGNSLVDFNFSTCEVNITTETTTAATTCKAFAIHEAGARVSQVITDQTDAFRSDFFGRKNSQPVTYSSNGCGSFGAITSGLQIRKFPIVDKPVYLSMEEFYEGLNAIYNLGLGVEEGGSGYVIRIEPKEYFYSTDVLFQIPNIPGLKRFVTEAYYYNRFEVGYNKWEIELVNGLDEPNSKRHYSLNLSIGNTLSAYSKLVASGYALEAARRKQYVDELSTDYEYDNENFIICLNRSVDGSSIPTDLDTAEKNENFLTVSNINSPSTAYNLRISPTRNALRWNNILSAGLIKYPASNLKFTYGEGNYKMESQFTSDVCEGNYNNANLVENQDIQWDGANTNNTPLWIPETYEFDYPLSFEQYKSIKSNPTKCLEISPSGTNFIKAYIIEIRYKPSNGMASFKLLRANA